MKKHIVARLASGTSLFVLALGVQGALTQHAQAQTAAAPAPAAAVDEIVVTGSRVIRDGYEAPTPLTVVGTEALERSGVSNVADMMNQMPTFSGSASSAGNVGTNTGVAGISSLSLRGLGATRTLTPLFSRNSQT